LSQKTGPTTGAHLAPLHVCGECHHWRPLDVMSSLGECTNRDSEFFHRPLFRSATAPHCFVARDLKKGEFLWCDRCKQTVLDNEVDRHEGHALFIGTAQFPVEENREITHAGD